jgi:hypothetical protein
MTMSKRERYVFVAVAAAVLLFVIDQLVLTPYLERRQALVELRQARQKQLDEVRHVLGREQRLRRLLVAMSGQVRSDPSQAEDQILHLLHDFEGKAGVSKASFQRLRSIERYGYTHMTFHVSASGRMQPIAALVYLVETAPVPLRIDEMEVLPKGEGGEDLQVQFTVSTLCRRPGAEPANGRGGVAWSTDIDGGGR